MDPVNSKKLEKESRRRRTFAIISHPDAGKTTLTEKLLLYGGAIHLAGNVKAKKNQKYTTSDWMELEKQRGISVSTTVLQFDYEESRINLLDTPGHRDFSEDTYRTLMAADAAVMLIDAAKGVEPQTKKLFEVCRMRGIPIFTFVNKMDRPSKEPIELIDEIESVLGIRSTPITWPIGRGDQFKGVYGRLDESILVYDSKGGADKNLRLKPEKVGSIDDPKFMQRLESLCNDRHDAESIFEEFKAELELVEVAGDEYDHDRILRGDLTPVFFGSALNNFGVEPFLQEFIKMAPAPVPRESEGNTISPENEQFSALVFKIQANMDPKHRDRVAFVRICSGMFERNMQVKNALTEKTIKVSMPLQFFAQERVIVDDAWPGDIIGVLDTGDQLRIGDTIHGGKKKIRYDGMPTFSPEHFARVVSLDPLKRKQLQKGLNQLAEEGVVQLYRQYGLGDKDPIAGAVGVLQFDVFRFRLELEYGAKLKLEIEPFQLARWISGADTDRDRFVEEFNRRNDSAIVLDRDDHPVVLFKSDWSLQWAKDNYEDIEFLSTAPR